MTLTHAGSACRFSRSHGARTKHAGSSATFRLFLKLSRMLRRNGALTSGYDVSVTKCSPLSSSWISF